MRGRVTIGLEPEARSVGEGRRFAAAAARRWGLVALTDDVAAVVSELVTNAVLHAGPPLALAVATDGAALTVEVHDASPDGPVVGARVAEPVPSLLDAVGLDDLDAVLAGAATTGRGMHLIEALASSWGWRPAGGGKVVWAVLGGEPAATQPAHVEPRRTGHPGGHPVGQAGHPVRLIALPVRLLAESALGIDSLVRELQVAALDGQQVAAALLGEMCGALDLLGNQRRRLSDARDRALARGDRLADVDAVALPTDLEATATVQGVVARVAAMSDASEFLITPPSAEVTAFRRWMYEEVVRQVGGSAPTPCPMPVSPPETAAAHHQALAVPAPRWSPGDDEVTVLRGLLRTSIDDFGAAQASLWMRTTGTDRLALTDSIGMAPEVTEAWRSIGIGDDLPASEAVRTGLPVVVRTSAERDLRYPVMRGRRHSETAAIVTVPLVSGGDPAIGAWVLTFSRSGDVGARGVDVLTTVAADASEAVRAARSTGRHHDAAADVLEALTALTGDLDERLRAAVAAIASRAEGWTAAYRRSPDGGVELVASAHADPERAALLEHIERTWPPRHASNAVVRCLREGEPVVFQVVPDELLAGMAESPEHLEAMRHLGLSSVVLVPVLEGGRVVAAIGRGDGSGRYVTDAELRSITAAAAVLGRPTV